MKTNLRLYGSALAAITFSVSVALAQGAQPDHGSDAIKPWHSDSVVFVAGLADLKQNTVGSLALVGDDLVFSAYENREQIPLKDITLVSIGGERVATGGTSAKVVRKIPIFGIGAAAGAVTSKTVDVLTVEYRDTHLGYHGAVFEVPKGHAEMARQQLMASVPPPPPDSIASNCNQAVSQKALLVAPIDENGLQLPPEYRVLLYEEMMAELQKTYATGTILRVGEQTAGCPSATLHVSVSAFKKGNETLRSSIGPVGFFLGGTSVAVSTRLIDRQGTVVFEKNLKNSKYGDSDSLGVARDVARSVSKHLAKMKGSAFEPAA